MARKDGIAGVASEFSDVSLGDVRLDHRLARLVELMASAPGDSFPDQMDDDANLEALYRFLSNSKVTSEALLAGHVRETHDRMRGRSLVRVLHDTSLFRFDGDREGLGILLQGQKGFLGHFALAVADGEAREPLGVLGVRTFIHAAVEARRAQPRKERLLEMRSTPREEKESSRWEKLAMDVSSALPKGVRAIHVMDQEADDFALLGELDAAGLAFVVRGDCDRLVSRRKADKMMARDALGDQAATLFRNVRITARTKKQATARSHPERREREAQLSVKWGRVTLQRPQYAQSDLDELSLYAVHVFEATPPAGESPVEWMLFTSEPVETLEQATAIVDHYRARWVIEEYFKALKTGCSFEKRQLMSFDGLVRALALFVPMAWKLLVLRNLGRTPGPTPASFVFDREQLLLLRALLEKRRYEFAAKPTVRDAMLGIARLGGHIKNNGDPGWQVLGRGLVKFSDNEVGWRMARERSDQS